MVYVSVSEYPSIRSWETKIFAMPNIPRGSRGFQESLKNILIALKNNTPSNTLVNIPGSSSENSLEDLYIRLRPSGIVKKLITGWEISQEAEKWLETEDDLYLAAILNANIRFCSEILAILKNEPKKAKEIQDVANNKYKLSWKTKSEIHARLNWLKDLRLIEFEDFSLNYYITDLGAKFLSAVGYLKTEELKTYKDSTVNETEVSLSPWAWEMCKLNDAEKSLRKSGMGYYPGSVQAIHNTILDYLLMMNNRTEFSTIAKYSSSTFGISESSTRAFISSLINLGFVERKTKTLYQTTELGRRLPTENFEIDFACCINKKFSFTFEILFELHKENLSAKKLAVIAKVSHGFPSENTAEINKRLHVLKNAKLVQETGVNLFNLTKRGEIFCEKLKAYYPINDSGKIEENNPGVVVDTESDTDNLLNEIRLSSRDSSNPNRFEKALKEAFALLGFKADWLGGSGKTDILLQAPTSPKYAYAVAVDAKTTYSGGITESQINFDTLVDHRKKHNADFSVVVGREFQGERLIERAIKHGVALLDIEKLESLIKMHREVPLKSDSYKKIFVQKGIVNTQVIEEDRSRIIRDGKLLQIIMKCLFEESEDPVTEGIMQPREIYLILKNQIKLKPLPSIEEITQMLEFLSSPLIGCIDSTKEGYFALGSLTDAAQKFDFYLKACRS
jgi:predicted transcriptional regulator